MVATRRAAAWRQVGIVLIVTAIAAAPASAQDRPITVTIGGAVVGPLSDSADRFKTGLGGTIGVTWHPTVQAGVRLDYVWSRLGARNDWPKVPLAVPIAVRPRIQFLTASFSFQAPPARVRPYIVGGVGVYWRSVRLSSSGSGGVSICDPLWFVCQPESVEVGRIVGSHSSTDLGLNVGLGFRTGRFFAEIRYHSIWGPAFTTGTRTVRATGRFLPLTVGVMF